MRRVRLASTSEEKKRPSVDQATQWAIDVVDGKLVSGKLAIAACRRHLQDLENGHLRGLHYDRDRVEHAVNFFPEVLSVTAGAMEGEPFHLLPWHTFVVSNLFGWRNENGRMRFRRGWLETGKGQAKSPLMAAIGIYMMGFYGIARSEVYAIGQDKDTANVLFQDAVAMCRAKVPSEGESLEDMGKVVIRGQLKNAHKIEHPGTNSSFEALANSSSVSGPRPSAVLADEIHEFKGTAALETWSRAIAKMPGDSILLMGTNTPTISQITGSNYSTFYQKVAKGEIKDDSAFSYIARVDPSDYETVFDNEECWSKALPALDVTFPRENIRAEVETARILASTAMSVKRLYFGIPTGAIEFWIDEEAWASVQKPVNPDDMRGLPCWLSLDLSQKNDLTALTAVWTDADGHMYTYTWYWTTKNGLEDREKYDGAPYSEWIANDYLTGIDAPTIDKTFVAAQVAELLEVHDVKGMVFDPAGVHDFIKACDEHGVATWLWEGKKGPKGRGLMIIRHGQGLRAAFEDKQLVMPRSVERFEDAILKKMVTVDDSPVTYSCAANACLIEDGFKNRAFDKKKSRGRIDGLVTNAMAVGAATSEYANVKRKPIGEIIVI